MSFGTMITHLSQFQNRVTLYSVEVYDMQNCITHFKAGGTEKIMPWLTTLGLDFIFVLNGGEFFGALDYYATQKNLPLYETLKDDSGQRKKLTCEAWTYKEGTGATYSRKIWLNTCKPNTRHKRIHATAFLNFSAVVGVNTLDELCQAVNVNYAQNIKNGYCLAELFAHCVQDFNQYYYNITGGYFLGNNRVACWTMGGAARNFYLKLRFPTATQNRLKLYQYSHPQNMKLEYYLRDCKLLPPGLLYTKDRGILHTGKFYKLDVNSLFADREKVLPELGALVKSTFEEYQKDKSGKYEYIFILNYAKFRGRDGLPRLFSNPFQTYKFNADTVEINEDWAIFEPYFNILKKFYFIEDFEIKAIYRARKNPDPAIIKYVDILYKYKQTARQTGKIGFGNLVKYFLVNLHGKFAQKSVDTPKRFTLDTTTNTVIRTEQEEIIDEWVDKHFDYIRGAYIYTMARVRIMELILRFSEVLPVGETLQQHIFYDDTDSIITDLEAPADIIDPYELGKLKVEETFTAFECVAPKTYWGRTIDNKIKLVCAGMDKEEVFDYLAKIADPNIKNISDKCLHSFLTDPNILFPATVLTRMQGGSGYQTTLRPLSTFDTDKIF